MTTTIQEILPLLAAQVRTEYNAAYVRSQAQSRWGLIASDFKTNLRTQSYAWLGGLPVMEEFRDEVREQGITSYNYSITDKVFKAALSIERIAIEDDQTDMIMVRARDMAAVTVRFMNRLAYRALPLGFTNLGPDKQNFFDTLHPDGQGGTYSNRTTDPLNANTLKAAMVAMENQVDDKGEPLEVMPTTLVVGPALRWVAEELVTSPVAIVNVGNGTAGTGATAATDYRNVLQGKLEVVVSPYIRGADAFNWFLLDTSREVKPIIMQSRSDIPPTTETDMEDGAAMIREIYTFTARCRCNVGYGLPQLAYASAATSGG